MKGFTPGRLKRFRQLSRLLWKCGHSDLVRHMDPDADFDTAGDDIPGADYIGGQLADDLEAMGPTYVKLGQMLSSRSDLLSAAYLHSLERLQDRVKPVPFEEVEAIITAELGARISKAFSRFDPEPIAAASLGQVHAAALRDGREVVVKVQRPGIPAQIAEDFEVLGSIAGYLDAHTRFGRRYQFVNVIEEMRATIRLELDYEREAQNIITMAGNLDEFRHIQLPLPVLDYSTRRVLTMEYIEGRKITSLSPLARLELDGAALAEEVFRAYLKQVLVDGIFHADPHPGNVFITADGRVALLDLGMVGHVTPRLRERLLKTLFAISEGKSDEASEEVIQLSHKLEHSDMSGFRREMRRLLDLYQDQALGKVNVGMTLLQIARLAGDNGLLVPSELTLLGKTLLQLSNVGQILDPEFNATEALRRHLPATLEQLMGKEYSRGSIINSILELKDFAVHLPERINRILDRIAGNEIEVTVRTLDVKFLMEGLHKLANRITTGLILSALIVGASLLMQVETSFRIFGYPGIAMLFFLAAATGSIWLIVSIFIQDRRSERDLL